MGLEARQLCLQGRHAENLAAMHIPNTVEVLSKIL